MIRLRQLAIGVICTWACLASSAQNLISNPGNELPLVGGNIQGWTEVQGTQWTQREADPSPFEGASYFFAGAVADATLRQVISVSSLSDQIDAGVMLFEFSGWVRSWPQSPSDTSRIVLSLLDNSGSTLVSFDSGIYADPSAWENVAFSLVAPALTRSVSIDLVAHRNAGSNNDGYFDDLSLIAAVVPEPSSSALFGIGSLGLLLARRLRRKQNER